VQGFNVQVPGLGPAGAWLCGLVTLGEGWHNNHHAFPASSRLGLQRHQWDPGWWVLCALRRAGLVSHLALPADLAHRPALVALAAINDTACAGATRAGPPSTSSVGRPS
jgi:hypothetical protein